MGTVPQHRPRSSLVNTWLQLYKMGGNSSKISKQDLEVYKQLTFFTEKEIFHCCKRFEKLVGEEIVQGVDSINDERCQVSMADTITTLQELKVNPFALRICKVFDYDEDNLLGHSDIRKVVEAITNSGEGAGAENIARLDKDQVSSVVENVLNETDLNRTGFISLTEFKQIVTNSPDFAQSFRIKL